METVAELIRKQENEYTRGTTQTSEYVSHSMFDTLNRVDAYINSKHISGDKDSKGRLKPFMNIVVAAANIWFKAIDIDRRHIRFWSKQRKQWVNSFFMNIVFQDWMKREFFGKFLNSWGRVQSRHNSAMIKFIENSSGLHMKVVPWNRLIVDPVDADSAPKIETFDLSDEQLMEGVDTHNYDKEQVEKLIKTAKKNRETLNKNRKDNRPNYHKIYEVHYRFPLSYLTDNEEDKDKYQWQIHVVSFVGGKKKVAGKLKYEDFTLYRGKVDGDPYYLTHLLKEDDRTLAIGPVEYLFDAQWMQNHAAKSIKDQLDVASKLLLQTSDSQFLGRNVLDDADHGAIFINAPNTKIERMFTASHDIVSWQNYAVQFREIGQEMVGATDALRGQQPKSGTAWRLQEAILTEGYSLFEVFTENRAQDLEVMLRERILPYLLKKYNNDKEIAALLEKNDLERIDRRFIKNEAVRRVNDKILKNAEAVARGEDVSLINRAGQQKLLDEERNNIQEQLQELGNQRFFKPSEVSWAKQLKGTEWEIEIDIGGEAHNIREILGTINTAIKTVTMPGFDENPRAQYLVGKALELAGGISPTEFYAIPQSVQRGPVPARTPDLVEPEKVEAQRNIK